MQPKIDPPTGEAFNAQISPSEGGGIVYPTPEGSDASQGKKAPVPPKDFIKHSSRSSPYPAIREFCAECMGGSKPEVRTCPSTKCPLWNFRLGRSPEAARYQEPDLMNPAKIAELHAKRNKRGVK